VQAAREAVGTGTVGLPCRARTPREPAVTPVSTGMVVVATLPEQTVLVVDRFTAFAWPGPLALPRT